MKKQLRLVKPEKPKTENKTPVPSEVPASEDLTPVDNPQHVPLKKQPNDSLS